MPTIAMTRDDHRIWIALAGALVLGVTASAIAQPTVHEGDNRLEIRWQGDLVAEIRERQHLRFRASGFNDHWLGTAAVPMDLGWDYRGKDYVGQKQEVTVTATGFVVTLEGAKPRIDGKVRTRLEARLISPDEGFHYTLTSHLVGSQEKWRRTSPKARGVPAAVPVEIEALDFHLNRISHSDLYDWRNPPGDALLYDNVVLAAPGGPWRSVDLLYTPYPIRQGGYPTIYWNHDMPGETGMRIGFLDRREGGWMQEILQTSAPIKLEQCWLAVDAHFYLPTGIPARVEGRDTFEVSYSFGFTPVSRQAAAAILDQAEPMKWQHLPEYQVPVFSRFSTFEERLAKKGQYIWCPSSYQCAMDHTVGYDDSHSIKITHARPGEKSAWYVFTWGPHFDTGAMLKGRFRISAQVKTRDCTGEFRLAVVKFGDGDIFLRRTGKWTSTGRYKEVDWFYGRDSITGTQDWTQLHLDVDIDLTKERVFTRHGIILEYTGAGSIWFDNVRVQQLE